MHGVDYRTKLGILILLFAPTGCDLLDFFFTPVTFVEVASERTKLIKGIESYQSIVQAKDQFSAWRVIERSSLHPQDKRPPFTIYKVRIENYSHLGVQGDLHIKFFNNRLAETRFFPQNFSKYVDHLKRMPNLEFKVNSTDQDISEGFLDPFTRIWIYKKPHLEEFGEKKYIGWEDTRLGREESLWIKRYS